MSVVRTTCPYCGVGCGLIVTNGAGTRAGRNAEDRAPDSAGRDAEARVPDSAGRNAPGRKAPGRSGGDPEAASAGHEIMGDPSHPANFGRLCSKGAALGETLGLDGRLLYPEIGGRRAGWDDALAAVADGFARTIAAHGPDAVAFYVSGQLLTEDYYVANKLMKGFIGSANIDTNSRLCMASAVAGHKRAFGADVVPCTYEDIERAELLVIVGSNLAWCHPVLYQRIRAAKAANAALKIIVIDPRRTATTELADLFLPIRPGTDVVLFNGLLSYLCREEALDFAFLDTHAEGFGAAFRAARESAGSIPAVARACGVPERDIAKLYRTFLQCDNVVTLFSQGVNQSSSGTDKVNSIVNVHLATGRIGKPGAGPFSLTGQPNAMGGREVGGLANQLAAHMDFDPRAVERVGRFWNAPNIAERPGHKAVELFDAMHAGRIKAVWIMATNPVVSMPSADRVADALRRCELVVVSDCIGRTDTTAFADVLLPAAAWGEKSGTVTNSERRISRQRAFMPPPGDARPDWWIVTEVARRMGFGDAFRYRSPADIFREHARLSAFENDGGRAFDIGALAEITDAEYDALEPVRWPCRATGESSAQLLADGRCFTPSGKARLVPTLPRAPVESADSRRPFVLNTGRVRDQWHTMTRTGRSPRLSGYHAEPFVQIHPADAARLGLRTGGLAEISSGDSRVIARVEITPDVQPGHVFLPMHWNEQFARRARVGTLIAGAVDPVSGQPELKHAPVDVRAFDAAWYGFVLTRDPPTLGDCAYFVRAKGSGHWRFELAGCGAPPSWPKWARDTWPEADEWAEFADPASGFYRGAGLREGRLTACVFVSTRPALPDRGWLAGLFGDSPLGAESRAGLLTGRAPRGAPGSGPLVCSCFSVGRDSLIAAIRSQALVTTEQIGAALSAGTNCGSCLPDLRALLADFAPVPGSS